MKPRILAFAGSVRRDSINQRFLDIACGRLKDAGAEVTALRLADYPMPLYDGDLEESRGLPEPARELKKLMREHDGLLIASPEYNSSFTPLMKNTIDWLSRREDEDPTPLAAFRGKTAALISASNGKLGGLRGLAHLRQVLANIHVIVITEQLALSGASKAMDDDGQLTDDTQSRTLDRLAQRLVAVTLALRDQ